MLKSPRGICLQLESGKVIAIRASKGPQQFLNPNIPTNSNADNANDVIDMTNDDDEEEPKRMDFSTAEEKLPEKSNKSLPKPNLVSRKTKEVENLNSKSWNQSPSSSMSYYPFNQHSNGQYSAQSEQRMYKNLFKLF